MKEIRSSIHLACDCGMDVIDSREVDQFATSMAQVDFECVTCKTKYFLHIQEVRKVDK